MLLACSVAQADVHIYAAVSQDLRNCSRCVRKSLQTVTPRHMSLSGGRFQAICCMNVGQDAL
jgi:hypothetical protein